MVVEYAGSESSEMSQVLTGINVTTESPQDLVGPGPAVPTTQDYIQAYNEALEGYRRRFEVLERYSALLNR